MNKNDRAILLGMVFGDGHLRKNAKCNTATLQVKHGAKQKGYAEFKSSLVTSVLGGKRPPVRQIDNNGFVGYVWDKTNSYFRVLRGWLYKDGKKMLSPYVHMLDEQGLALWYMDDGGLGRKFRRGKIHGVDLYINCHAPHNEAEAICLAIEKRFGIIFKPCLNNGLYRIRCGTHEARKFARLVVPFMHDSLMYKLAIPEESTSAPPERDEIV